MYDIRKNQKYTVWIILFLFTIILEVTKAEVVNDTAIIKRTQKNNCECILYDCGCCEHIEWDAVHLNGTFCTNATYLVNDYGFSVTVTYNNVPIINETLSARNPPPICVGEAFIENFPAEVCFRLYDIDIKKHYFHCCFELEARFAKLRILPLHLGCFDSNHTHVPSNDVSLTPSVNILQMTLFIFIISNFFTCINQLT